MRFLRIGLVLGLAVATAACGSDDDSAATTVPDTARPTTLETTAPSATTTPVTQPPVTTAPAQTTTPATTTPAVTSSPTLVDDKVYFLRDERLVIAHREVPGPAVLRGALTELLAGPTADELASGLVSTVPDGTELRDVNLADGVATVDLSSDYETGGGTLSMTARVAQVVFTATQFANSDRVQFWLEGAPIEYLGGEGIVLGAPLARMDIDRNLTGSVIIDSPAYGASVKSPFTVTGEGDVFEAQFPIEIWANGEQIGGLAPVTAGAWGVWADFEVTITLDAPPGEIELVAYDPGGCGTDPECPEIIRTVVPLTFTG